MIAPSAEQAAEAKAALAERRAAYAIVHGGTPHRILARIKKCGPLSYQALAQYIAGSRMLQRDKYIDPSLKTLKDRGFIVLSKVTGDGRWTITPAGRVAVRDAKPSARMLAAAKNRETDKYKRFHEEHIARQVRAGIPSELIYEGLADALPGTR